MTAVGYATLPIIPSLKGLQKTLSKELQAPINDATKKAKENLTKGLGDAAEAAAKKVEDARKKEEYATRKVIDAEKELKAEKEKTAAAEKKASAAADNLKLAQLKSTEKIQEAEEKLQKVKEKSTSTTEDIKKAENELKKARLSGSVDVEKKESALESARSAVTSQSIKLSKAEEELSYRKKRSKEANENLIAANKQLENGLGSLTSKNSKAGQSFDKLKGKIKSAAGGLGEFSNKYKVHAAAALGGISLLTKGAISYASEAEQSYGAAETVFGKYSDKIIEASKNAAQEVGLSGREYRELSSGIGAMLKNMGTPLDQVADKSMNLTSIAADLAATYGGTTKEAVESVNSLLRGEADPIEKYGISIKQSDINARMAAEGLDKLEGSAKKQAQAQVLMKMLTEQSGDAIGQFGREADTAAGKQQRSTATLDDLKEAIGTGLLPIYGVLTEKMGKVAKIASEHPKLFTGIVASIAGLSGSIIVIAQLSSIFGALASQAALAGTTISGLIASTAAAAAPFIAIAAAIAAAGVALWAFFTKTEKGKEIFAKLKDYAGSAVDFIKEKFGAFTEWFTTAWDGLKNIFIKGDFTESLNKAFNIDEDSPIINFILKLREHLMKIPEIFNTVKETIQPILLLLIDFTVNSLGNTLNNLWTTLQNLGSTLITLGQEVFSVFITYVKTLWDTLTGLWNILEPVLLPVLKTIGIIVGGVVVGAFMGLVKAVEVLSGILNILASAFKWIVENIMPPLFEAINWLIELFGTILVGTFQLAKDIIVGAFNAITTGWEFLVNGIKTLWDTILHPVINFFVEAFKMAFTVITTMVLTPLYLAWEAMSLAIKAAYEHILKPVITGLSHMFQWLYNEVITPVIQWIIDRWNSLTQAFKNGWTIIKTTVIDPLAASFQWLWNSVINPVLTWIKNKWTWLKDSLIVIYNIIKTAVFEALSNSLNVLKNVFNSVLNWIKNKWSWLSSNLHSTWKWIDDHVFKAMGNGLDRVKGWYRSAADSIGRTWEEVRTKTAKPINWVINSVYNNGIRKVWDKVSDFIGLDKKLPAVKTIAYKTGGILPGYTPGRDVHEFMSPTAGRLLLSGGEAIMRPEVTKAMGTGAVDALNNAAAHGGVNKVKKMLGEGAQFNTGGIYQVPTMAYAKGGDVKIERAIKRTLDFVRGEHGKPYQYGGVGNPSWDCSGLWSGVYQELQAPGTARNGRLFNTESNFGSFGFTPGLTGRVTIGVLSGAGGGANGHMAGTIDGHNIESASNPKGVQIDGSAWGSDNGYFNHTYTLQDFSGKFVSGGNGGAGGGNFIRHLISSAVNSILSPIENAIPVYPGMVGEIPRGAYKKIKDAFVNFLDQQSPSGSGGAAGGVSGNVESWRPLAIRAIKHVGLSPTDANVNAMLAQIQSESGGIPNRLQEVVDINSGGNEGMGLLQIIPGTFASFRDPSLPNDRTDPYANMVAALNYYKSRYGNDLTTTWGHGHGYSSGGVVDYLNNITTRLYDQGGILNHGAAAINLSGKPEAILTNDQWKTIQKLAMGANKEVNGAFIGRNKGYADLAKLLHSDKIAKNVLGFTHNVGDFLGQTEEGKRAVEELNKAIEEQVNSTHALKEAEKDLADAKDKGDKDKITEAEKKLKEARINVKDKTKNVIDAENKVAETRGKAAVDIIENLIKGINTSLDAAVKFYNGLGDLRKQVEETRNSIRELEITQANDRINSLSALYSLRMAEIDLSKSRAEGALKISQAENALYEARFNSTMTGATGVNALAEAIDRFRETGVFSLNQLTEEFIVRTQAVRVAEAELSSVRADSLLNQEAAGLKFLQSQIAANKVLLEQQKNAALLELQTRKLTQQTAQLYGMNQHEVTGAQRGLQGKQKTISGSLGLLGSIAGGVFSFMTGNVAGGIGSIVSGVKSIGDIITGAHELKTYKKEAEELEKSLPKSTRAGLILGNVASAGSVALGALGASQGLGLEALNGGIQVGSQINETMYGSLLSNMNTTMDKINLDFEAGQAALMQDYNNKIAKLEMDNALAQLQSQIKTSDLEAAKELAELNKQIAQSNSKKEIAALGDLAKIAEERRDTLNKIQSDAAADIAYSRSLIEKQVNYAENNSKKLGNKELTLNIPLAGKSAYSAEEVEAILNGINNAQEEIKIRLTELESQDQVSGSQFMDANRR